MKYKNKLIEKAIRISTTAYELDLVWPSIRNLLDTDRDAFSLFLNQMFNKHDYIKTIINSAIH